MKPIRFNLKTGEYPELIEGFRVSANIFQTLKVRPLLGRTFLSSEEKVGMDNVVVISHGLWQRRFGCDPNMVGKSIIVNANLVTIVGIMPSKFQFIAQPDECEMWQPYVPGLHELDQWDTVFAIARFKNSVNFKQARMETELLGRHLAREYPEAYRENTAQVHIRPARPVVGMIRDYVWPLMGTVAFVLLIACANVANMLLARAASREKEMAIRMALGANQWRVIRLTLIESLVLAFFGACLGLLFAHWGVRLLTPLIPSWLPVAKRIQVDNRMLAQVLFIFLVTGASLGMAPAWQSFKTNLTKALKEGGTGSIGRVKRRLLRKFLVVSEVALALVLLIGAGLMIQSAVRLLRVDPGFNPHNLLEFRFQFPTTGYISNYGGSSKRPVERYQNSAQRRLLYERIFQRINSLPGVESVGAVSRPSGNYTAEGQTTSLRVESYRCSIVSYDYLRTIGARLLQGRHFNQEDLLGTRDKTIINEVAARKFWPGESPIGKRLRQDMEAQWLTIVGVIETPKLQRYAQSALPGLYRPSMDAPCEHRWDYAPESAWFVVRTSGDPISLIPVIRREFATVDLDLGIREFTKVEDRLLQSTTRERLYMRLLTFFGIIGLIIAAIGIYGIISYSVVQRTHEIGVRMALGAYQTDVLRIVLKKGLMFISLGLTIGVVGALALTRVLKSLLYDVTATDPMTFVAVSLLLMIVGLIACYIPARRAARIDPINALRYE